ncbi:hypothetical protein E3T40_15460 [Cryobacterium sp. TMT1-19]|uniref:hypothetical protein n=2 Tax=unclassified Cryobacterium TaxID=2649013 RepID=UPI001068DA1E|nr:hypothetical protein [Cryobacterium sp. TMT1-19]TFD30388.1 hypothetical protein E3T40_15460 [Cryobacterium sp. TMT1-19]
MSKVIRAVIVGVGVTVLLVGALIAVVVISGDPAPIERAAAALKPAPGWTVTQTSTEPPRRICLGGVACPSILRMWSIPAQLSAAEFLALVDRAGWEFPVTGDCEPQANIFGGQTLCEARGTDGGFDIVIAQMVDRDGGPLVWLYVEAAR